MIDSFVTHVFLSVPILINDLRLIYTDPIAVSRLSFGHISMCGCVIFDTCTLFIKWPDNIN